MMFLMSASFKTGSLDSGMVISTKTTNSTFIDLRSESSLFRRADGIKYKYCENDSGYERELRLGSLISLS